MRIVSTNKVEQYDVSYIECFALEGNMTILLGHEPAIVVLKPGTPLLLHFSSGEVEPKETHNALLDIDRDELVCIDE